MIDKKLNELGKYVEEIQKKESFNLLKAYMNQVNEELKDTDNVQSDIELDFENKLVQVIDNYKVKGLPNSIISYHLFNIIINFIKNSVIEQKASELEIDKRLYKNEMRLLFKGKWKK
ncbi:MAG: hypothetical protein LN408_02015 [Candidatus Thermoplasmatota archaeon]|nr:hypothetical protein [Candidatus Thermoplasmatota archaeon]